MVKKDWAGEDVPHLCIGFICRETLLFFYVSSYSLFTRNTENYLRLIRTGTKPTNAHLEWDIFEPCCLGFLSWKVSQHWRTIYPTVFSWTSDNKRRGPLDQTGESKPELIWTKWFVAGKDRSRKSHAEDLYWPVFQWFYIITTKEVSVHSAYLQVLQNKENSIMNFSSFNCPLGCTL